MIRLCSLCDNPHVARGYCNKHYIRYKKYGDPLICKRAENGSGTVQYGYRKIMINGVKKMEHHWVMEEFLGRELIKPEEVHHKNGDTLDNRIENLELWSTHQPPGQRVSDKVDWAIEILRLYSPECLSEDIL